MTNMDIEKKIPGILKKDREGITISEMAEKLKVHRHTMTKYIYRLEGKRKIKIRKIGIAKLCYLNELKQGNLVNNKKKGFSSSAIFTFISLFLLSFLAYTSFTGFFLYQGSVEPTNITGNISLEKIQKLDNNFAELSFENEISFRVDFPVSENKTYNLTLLTNFSEPVYLRVTHKDREIYNSELKNRLGVPVNLTEGLQKFNFTFYKEKPEKGLPITGFFAAQAKNETKVKTENQTQKQIEINKTENQTEIILQINKTENQTELNKTENQSREENRTEITHTNETNQTNETELNKTQTNQNETNTINQTNETNVTTNETNQKGTNLTTPTNKTENQTGNETEIINQTNQTLPTNQTNLTQPINETITELNITDLPSSIKINSPSQNEVLENKLIIINLTAIDNNLNYTNTSILQGGNLINSTLSCENGTFFVNLSVPDYGNYTIVARVYDLSGNSNSTEVNIQVKRKPTLKIDFIGLIPITKEKTPVNETNLTTPETITINYSELEQGKIKLNQPVELEQEITIKNPTNKTETLLFLLPVPDDAFNLSLYKNNSLISTNKTVNLTIEKNQTVELLLKFYSSPVKLEIVESKLEVNLSDLLPPEAGNINIYEGENKIASYKNLFETTLTLPRVEKQILVYHNSSLHYHNISVELPLEGNYTLPENLSPTYENKTLKFTIPKLSEINISLKPEIKKIQKPATINESVKWKLERGNISIEYETPAPTKKENPTNKGKKIIINSNSSVHYHNITAFSDLPELNYKPKIHRIVNGTRLDITNNPIYRVTYKDTDNNSLYDRIQWIVPKLSNDTYEIELTILNVQSYPTLGGNWTVRFNTTGTANLTIKAVNGTTWSLDGNKTDLQFLEIKCRNQTLNYTWINNSIFIPDYSCNYTSYETSKVLTTGKHTIQFTFGNITKYAYNRVDSITLNSPPNQTATNDNRPDFDFTVTGNQSTYSCELFINDTGYGNPNWYSDSTVVSGLVDIGANSAPEVYQKDSTWHLISGESGGGFTGFQWNGTDWISNSSIVSGLSDVGSESTPTVYQKDSTWYLISGKYDGAFNGFQWNGTDWVSNSSVVSGLGDIGYWSTPTVYQKDTTWYLISGEDDGVFNGYQWNGTDWVENSTVVSGSGDVGDSSEPTVYQKDSIWYLISGEVDGDFYGFHWNALNNTPTIITANSTLSDGLYNWYINCTADSTTNTSEIREITIDTTNPIYSQDQDNSEGPVLEGTIVNVSTYWEDTHLDTAEFYHNASGSYVLNSTCSLSGTADWCNKTIDTTGMGGKNVCWKQYANDSAGNVNNTMTDHCFNVVSISVILNSPPNQTATTDTTPDFNFTVSGSENCYFCELFINDSGYGTSEKWYSDSAIVSGLGDVGSRSSPSICNNCTGHGYSSDYPYELIAGEDNGVFNGFYYNGTDWVSDSAIVSGLGDIGSESAPSVCENCTGHGYSSEYPYELIAGEDSGVFNGFYYNGTDWVSDSAIDSGLGDIGSESAPSVCENCTGHGYSSEYPYELIAGEE